MIIKAGAIALVFIFIIGIFDLYDLVGVKQINDLFQESQSFRGGPVNDSGKIINYIFSWLTITIAVAVYLYFSSEKKRRKKLSQNA